MPPSASLRRKQRQSRVRRLILEAAEALLLDEGAEGFTMRKLALRCGYTAPTIYHYFGDKHLLLDTLLEQTLRGLLAELEQVPPANDPLDALRANFHAIVRFGRDKPRHYRVLLSARPEDADPLPSDEESRRCLEAPLEELFRAGRLRARQLEPVRQVLWSLLHGLISIQTHRPDVDWSPELARLALESTLAGLLKPGEIELVEGAA